MQEKVLKISKVISDFSVPLLALLITLLAINYSVAPNLYYFTFWSGLEIFFLVVLPGLYVYWLYQKGKVSDLRLIKQEDRLKPLLFAIVAAAAVLIILYKLHISEEILIFGLVYLVNGLIITIITKFWKISVHLAVLTVSILGMTIIINRWILLLLLLLPIVGWSRIQQKRHTLIQVLLSPIFSSLLTLAIFYFFGYLSL